MKRRQLGATMLIIGFVWMILILTVDERVFSHFNDNLLFILTCLSCCFIIFGIGLLLIKTLKEYNEEMQIKQDEQEKLKAYDKCVPYVTYALIIMNIVGSFLMGVGNGENTILQYAISKHNFSMFNMISSMFAHASLNHLFFNMVALYLCGHKLEAYIGKVKYVLVYFISGLGASFLIGIFSDIPSVGASGAIFGLLGCFLLVAIKNKEIFKYTLKYDLLPTVIISLIQTFVVPYISVIAHVGGLIMGMVCHVVFCRKTVLRIEGNHEISTHL